MACMSPTSRKIILKMLLCLPDERGIPEPLVWLTLVVIPAVSSNFKTPLVPDLV